MIPPFGRAAAGTTRSSRWSTGSSGRAHLQHLDVRPRRPPPPRERGGAAPAGRRRVRPAAGAGVQGLRRLARRRRGGGNRLGDRLPGDAPAAPAGRAPTWSTTTSRSSSPPRPTALWAAHTYELGLYGIAAGRWLRDLLARRYGQRGGWFQLGVDHEIYRPGPEERRRDTVIFYARDSRRGARCRSALLALQELHRRRPDVRFVLFGQDEQLERALRLRAPRRRRARGAGAALRGGDRRPVPVAHELLADPAGDAGLRAAVRGAGGRRARRPSSAATAAIELAEPDPVAIADAIERLLEDASCGSGAPATGSPGQRGVVGRRGAGGRARPARGAARARARPRHRGLLIAPGARLAPPQHERAERAGTVAVAGRQAPAATRTSATRCAPSSSSSEPRSSQLPGCASSSRAAPACRPSIRTVDLSPERARAARPRSAPAPAPAASHAPRPTRPSARARDRPCGGPSPRAAAPPRSATPGSQPRRPHLGEAARRGRLPARGARPDLVVAPAPLAPVLGRRGRPGRALASRRGPESAGRPPGAARRDRRKAEPGRRAVAGERRQPRAR